MAVDMRAFAASAHTALDEKERIKGRMRRLRYEWKQERSAQEADLATLERTAMDMERLIEEAAAEEEKAIQNDTRQECAKLRDRYRKTEYNERRIGYLRNQLNALSNELRKLGDVAGVTAKRDQGGERFNYEDPSTCHVLIRKLKSNDTRNESEHAFVQSLDAERCELEEEVAALTAEEVELLARDRAADEAVEAARVAAEKAEQQAARDTQRYEALAEHLSELRPCLLYTSPSPRDS